ncbi:hypothetical protein AB3R30_19045 [Leptolyngbyaceae cyanobacterium UHCC 1019]
MEEQTSPIQLPFHSAPPPYPETEYTPVAEDNVVSMPIQSTMTEDECRLNPAAKRKQRSSPKGKIPAARASKKALKAVRHSQSPLPYPYADELKRFEEHATRINQILADRAHKDDRITQKAAIAESNSDLIAHPQPILEALTQPTPWQVVQPPRQNQPVTNQPIKNQWQSPTPIEEQPVEGLNLQPGSIYQRLHELGLYVNETEIRASVSDKLSGSNPVQLQQSSMPNAETCQISSSFYPLTPATPSQIPQTEPFPNPNRGTAANRFPHDRYHSRFVSSPMKLRRYLRDWRRWLYERRSLELPRQQIERLSDAALWIATFAIVRVASRYVLAVFPMLSPIVLGVMLAPAIAAIYLIVCAPKAGWVFYYRLFLIMVGFLIGGKL